MVWYNVVQCGAVWCGVVWCGVVQCITVLIGTIGRWCLLSDVLPSCRVIVVSFACEVGGFSAVVDSVIFVVHVILLV